MDRIGAFVDMVEPVVAIEPLDRIVAGIAIAAEDLDRVLVGLEAMLGRPALGDRGQDIEQQPDPLAFARILDDPLPVEQQRAIAEQSGRALDRGLLCHQHPLDVGMRDDRHLRRGWVLVMWQATLRPVDRIVEGVEIAGEPEADRAMANPNAGLVHHVEHIAQPLVGLADQMADRVALLAEIEQAIDRAALAHLVVEADQRDVVPGADRAVVIHPPARHDEQRDALHPRRPAWNLRQHQMDDIVGEFMVAARDPHLRAADPVAAVAERFGPGADVRQRRSRLRLGQAHRPEPASFEQGPEEARLLLRRAERVDQMGVGDRQEAVIGERDIGRLEHAVGHHVRKHRQLHAADLLVEPRREQPRLGKGAERLAGLGRHLDLAVDEMRLIRVDQRGAGQIAGLGDRLGGIEHGGDRVAIPSRVTRRGAQRLEIEHLVEHEIDVAAVDDR